MATTVKVQSRLFVQTTVQDELGSYAPKIDMAVNLANGSSANQANLVYAKRHSITSGAPLSLDLAGGGLIAVGGAAATFTKVVRLIIVSRSTTPGQNLIVGGGSNAFSTWFNDASDKVKIGPGGHIDESSPIDGFTVTAGTGDILQIDVSSGTASVDVLIIGRS